MEQSLQKEIENQKQIKSKTPQSAEGQRTGGGMLSPVCQTSSQNVQGHTLHEYYTGKSTNLTKQGTSISTVRMYMQTHLQLSHSFT